MFIIISQAWDGMCGWHVCLSCWHGKQLHATWNLHSINVIYFRMLPAMERDCRTHWSTKDLENRFGGPRLMKHTSKGGRFKLKCLVYLCCLLVHKNGTLITMARYHKQARHLQLAYVWESFPPFYYTQHFCFQLNVSHLCMFYAIYKAGTEHVHFFMIQYSSCREHFMLRYEPHGVSEWVSM